MSHSIRDSRRRPAMLCLMALLGCAAISPAAFSADKPADKPKGQEISRVIAKEMTAAQKALQANQWTEALKNLDAAETKSGLTPFDEMKISYFKGFANIKLNNLKAAQAAFEKSQATGVATPEDKVNITRALFGISASTSQFQKTVEYGKEMADAGTASPNDLAIIAQSYYQLKDCKNSGVWVEKAVAASRKAGEAPKENLYLFKLQCASDAGDSGAMVPVLTDLIHLTNKTSYRNTLIRLERQDEREDRNTLMIYRVMYDVNAMQADTDYIEMAQLLGDAALPGEAQLVLEKLQSSGILKDDHKERTTRLLNAMKTRADADKKGLPALDAEANKNPAGQLDMKLGEVYYGAGDYQGAASAITRGLGKGQIKQQDEAFVYLARAQVQLKNPAEAKKALAGLKSVPNISPRVLKLWELYADKLG